jgi:adenylosuccinate synthase
MFNTNFCFRPGRLTILLDAQAGSSGKGKIGSFITHHANNWDFAVNTFMPQAGHWVKIKNGGSYFYQTFNSCAYQSDRYEKLYISPGAMIELPAFFREMEENKIPAHKIGISPVTAILQKIDGDFERGMVDFDGKPVEKRHDGTMKKGTTAHGCGANRARRVLRRPEALYARDVPELQQFLCDTPREIMDRLDAGQSGLFEIAQGFQLSYLLPEMFPYCTSRNCTVMAGLDDAMIPPRYAGNVIINCRTFPIRINNNKYLDPETGKHLTWAEVEEYNKNGKKYETYQGNSGPGYADQTETTWGQVTKDSNSKTPIMEMTSVTKLPRRVFTFSQKNLADAFRFSRTGNGSIFLSVNFMNYVDANITGASGTITDKVPTNLLTPKVREWLKSNLTSSQLQSLKFIGTGQNLDEQIVVDDDIFNQKSCDCENQ